MRFYGPVWFVVLPAMLALGVLLTTARVVVNVRLELAEGNLGGAVGVVGFPVMAVVLVGAMGLWFVGGTTRVVFDAEGVSTLWCWADRKLVTLERLKWANCEGVEAVGSPASIRLIRRFGGQFLAVDLDERETAALLESASALRSGSA